MALTPIRMSNDSQKRAEEFLNISGQFKLGGLVTESSHAITANLSEVAAQSVESALDLLFQVDGDVVRKYREFVESGRVEQIAGTVRSAIRNGGRIFFTGCGATGRLSILLDSVWRDFWKKESERRRGETQGEDKSEPPHVGSCKGNGAEVFENRTFSIMAGGDYALIKSVEGFEDFTAFGKKQIGDLGVSNQDVVFAITEGGETSFVIGTAWQGVEVGAKVYFVYNNPDEVLCQTVERSREVIEAPRIEKINLTTGPMAITGSTRMQATTIQLCVMLTILEVVVRDLLASSNRPTDAKAKGTGNERSDCPAQFLSALEQLHGNLRSPQVLTQLAKLVELEESVYRSGHKNNYFASRFAIDVLTDTTERSPTFCTPPFRKFDDQAATESWAFLFLPQAETPDAWRHILRREPLCVEWKEDEVRNLVGEEKLPRTVETVRKISTAELMRFKIGLDGLPFRSLGKGDCAVGIVGTSEQESLLSPTGFYGQQLEAARQAGADVGLICLETQHATRNTNQDKGQSLLASAATVKVALPKSDFLLDGVTRVGVKMLLNALSTCTMVRLGRVMGNFMIWVVPSNLKLIDRATRYIEQLTGLNYEQANHLLFEVIEYIEPRM
ncbi:MAG TPA: hypothetical protein VKA67_11430, partial [Verrucomicrobiae bacterium]|nr:hypothetical protein [Verrucomicrobiae bacterium]